MASGDLFPVVDVSLVPFFGWAGSRFPFVPVNAPDITIAAPTIWNDVCGYKQVNKLTINAGQTLSIQKSPFYIFANEISFGDAASCIDASGAPGSSAISWTAQGGGNSANVRGGDGGGMLFIIAGKITGVAGIIKANGGNGFGNAGGTAKGGQGSLSNSLGSALGSGEKWNGQFAPGTANVAYLHPLGIFLSDGGNTANCGKGGGSGYTSAGGAGGGSGIGGGAGYNYAGATPTTVLTPISLLELAKWGNKGGGGGANDVSSSGGGGGGSIVVWTRSVVSQPTLQANGGTGSGVQASTGGAGVVHFILM